MKFIKVQTKTGAKAIINLSNVTYFYSNEMNKTRICFAMENDFIDTTFDIEKFDIILRNHLNCEVF
jgi:hypothetical protein